MNYRISFEIDVDADSPQAAVEQGWELLSSPEAWLPVGTACDENGEITSVDLSHDQTHQEAA